jgi:hypothetical protein
MPDGNMSDYAPPAKIWNLREFTLEIRKLVPDVLEMMSDMLDNRKDLTPIEQLALTNLIFDRAYGRPRQVAPITDVDSKERPVRVYIPDNGRDRAVIDADASGSAAVDVKLEPEKDNES